MCDWLPSAVSDNDGRRSHFGLANFGPAVLIFVFCNISYNPNVKRGNILRTEPSCSAFQKSGGQRACPSGVVLTIFLLSVYVVTPEPNTYSYHQERNFSSNKKISSEKIFVNLIFLHFLSDRFNFANERSTKRLSRDFAREN